MFKAVPIARPVDLLCRHAVTLGLCMHMEMEQFATPAPKAHGMQVEAARRGYRWTDAAGHTVFVPVVPPAALTTIVSMCSGTDAKFGPLRSRLRLLRCYGALQEIAFAGVPHLSYLPTVPASRAICHAMRHRHSSHHPWWRVAPPYK